MRSVFLRALAGAGVQLGISPMRFELMKNLVAGKPALTG